MKMKLPAFYIFLLGFSLAVGFSSELAAKTSKSSKGNQKKTQTRSKAKKASSRSSSQSSKKKTVGELLRQADRGAGIALKNKDRIALPKTGETFFDTQKAKAINLNQVKPPRTSSFFEDADDDKAKLERITDKQIAELFKLTQKFRTSPQRGELWLRLAELYVEKAGVIDFRKQGEYDVALKEYQAGQRKKKPVLDLRDAKEYNRKAIQLYEWFVRDFPKDDKMDQALYFLGYNCYEIGDLKRGTLYYTRLTKEHPRSQYVTEANFALAEFYFENEKWKPAGQYYSQVLKYPRHRLYNFSMYKVAWCQFRLGSTVRALHTMEKLIRVSREQVAQAQADGRKNINKGRLESEGLRDIVLFYGEAGSPEKASAYFRSLAGADANNYLEKLAYYYGDKGNLHGARIVFNYLIQQNPTAAKAFEYKYQVVKLYSTVKKSRDFRDELFSWVRDFGIGSAWYSANRNNVELLDSSAKIREQTLRTYVLQQHQTAQNSRASFSQGLALEGYRIYLSEFKNSPIIADMHFYFAELLYDMNKFQEAGEQYRWVVENGKGTKFYARATENTILALGKELPSDDELSKKVGKSLEPVPMDAQIQTFVTAAQQYVDTNPESDKVPEMKFRIGRLYYQHNQFDQALPYFRDIVSKHPQTKYAEYSANLMLDIYNLRKDYTGLEKTGSELLSLPGIANTKAGSDIKGVLEKANFKRAQDLEVSKDYAGSAQQFEIFAKQNPGSTLATTALFNAAINYERAGMNSKAASNHAAVLASRDRSADGLKTKSRRIVAKLYQDSGRLEDSAQAYRAAAIEAGKDPVAANLFFNSAVLYQALGKNSDSIRNYEAYYDRSRKSDRVEAIYEIATMYRKQGTLTRAADKYEDYLKAGTGNHEKNVESAFHIYEISKRLRRTKQADEWKQKTLSLQRRYSPNKKGVGATYAAQIKLDETSKVFDELKAIRIPSNPAKQQQAAKNKIALVSRLNSDLTDVIKYDSAEEIVGALSLLGQVNLHMGDSLIKAPLPAGLSPDESKQYKAGIEKLAEPFFSKAKESLKAAVDRGSQLDVYNSAYHQARELVLKMDESLFYHGDEIPSESHQGTWVEL